MTERAGWESRSAERVASERRAWRAKTQVVRTLAQGVRGSTADTEEEERGGAEEIMTCGSTPGCVVCSIIMIVATARPVTAQ